MTTSPMPQTSLPLSPYRVLDLTEGGINWCGRVLADLGADVIKIEPPGGSPTRNRGPFYKDKRGPEHSLYWYAYCLNKRSAVVDLNTEIGRQDFLKLVATSDFLIESFSPGHMESLGLGYDTLKAHNPRLVMVSITPFGPTGPYAHFKTTDMISWSMGGNQYITGDPDRPPVRISVPQAELHAGAQAAAGAMIAFWHRQQTGEGQHVDVSIHTAVVWTLINASPFPPLHGINLERQGAYRGAGKVLRRNVFPCKDGYVSAVVTGGTMARRSLTALIAWMAESCELPEYMLTHDWDNWEPEMLFSYDGEEVPIYHAAQLEVGKFFAMKTKAELFKRAVSHGILLAPCNSTADIAADQQLEAREYWTGLEHDHLGDSIAYPGPFIKMRRTPIKYRRRAPMVGEHTEEVLKSVSDVKASETTTKGRVNNYPKKPFSGLKVLDFTWVVVGPTTTKYLADYGAEVVRIESPTRPDVLRMGPPFKDATPGINRSQFAGNFNTNKLGLGLDLRRPEGREVARRIIEQWQPDVIAESYTPRVMREWGLDYESVRSIKPDIIYFSTSQLGQTGPNSRFAGFGQLASALAGYYSITGWPDHDPAGPHGPYTDVINPPNALCAIVAALEHHLQTGEGQHLDLSQYECAIQYMAPAMLDYFVNDRVMERRGNYDDDFAPHGVYPCQPEERIYTGKGESWCAIAVTNETEWQALKNVMGNPAWAEDCKYDSLESRRKYSDELDALISHWTPNYTAHELMALLQNVGIPSGAVQSQADLWQDPQLKHQGHFRWLEHTECGPMPYDGPQFDLSLTPAELRTAHAMIGEHNELVLKKMAGLSNDEIAELIISEVVQTSF